MSSGIHLSARRYFQAIVQNFRENDAEYCCTGPIILVPEIPLMARTLPQTDIVSERGAQYQWLISGTGIRSYAAANNSNILNVLALITVNIKEKCSLPIALNRPITPSSIVLVCVLRRCRTYY